jgi:hypothetical protein
LAAVAEGFSSDSEGKAGAGAERGGHGGARCGPARPLHRHRGEGNAPVHLALSPVSSTSPALPTPALLCLFDRLDVLDVDKVADCIVSRS